MGKGMNKHVLAEGVETMDQADFLTQTGCSQMQGFLFGKAMSGREFEERVSAVDLGDPRVEQPPP
jgi:EAL domain-containing protein (putative c-di-GMP-specific phosphodiesterase class I)